MRSPGGVWSCVPAFCLSCSLEQMASLLPQDLLPCLLGGTTNTLVGDKTWRKSAPVSLAPPLGATFASPGSSLGVFLLPEEVFVFCLWFVFPLKCLDFAPTSGAEGQCWWGALTQPCSAPRGSWGIWSSPSPTSALGIWGEMALGVQWLTLRQMVLSCAARKSSSEGSHVCNKTHFSSALLQHFPPGSCLSCSLFHQINVGQLNWQIRLVFPAGTFDNWAFVPEDLCSGNTITSMEILFSPLVIAVPLIDIPLPIKPPD